MQQQSCAQAVWKERCQSQRTRTCDVVPGAHACVENIERIYASDQPACSCKEGRAVPKLAVGWRYLGRGRNCRVVTLDAFAEA